MSATENLVAGLLAIRQGKPAQSAFADLPLLEAYAVQAEVLRRRSEAVGGWKVAVGPGDTPIAAPLYASAILPAGAELQIAGPRHYKIEVEQAFRLVSDLPPRPIAYERAELIGAIGSVHTAFEVVLPRAGEPSEVPFGVFLADNLGNAFTIVAEKGEPLREPLPEKGELLAQSRSLARGAHPQGDPLAPLLLYANRQTDLLGGLRAGHIVITGSFTGAVAIVEPGAVEGRFDGQSSVVATFTFEG